MSVEWPVYKVADLEESKKLLVQDGNHGEYRPRKDEFVENGTAFIRAADLGFGAVQFDSAEKINDVALKRIRKGIGKDLDTILSTKGTVGKIAFVPEGGPRFVCSPQTSFWRSLDHDFLDPKYIYYELQSSHFLNQTSSRKGETDMADYLSLTSQRGLNIRVPDITVQREVAKILGSHDDKIEINRQINQTLEQIAQTIFKSWFVDFDPVKAKIEAKAAGRDPERAAMCAISGKLEPELDQLPPEQYQQLAATAALFPDGLVESELGLIPVGWELSSIGNEVEVVGGGTPSTKNSEYWENGKYHWTTPKDLSNVSEKILLQTDRQITKEGLDKISSGLLSVNTVLMSSRAPVGYLALAKVPVAINQGYIAMKCNQRLPPNFVLQWANSVMDEIKQRASGTTFAEISKKNFRLIQVIVPPVEVLGQYEQIAEGLYSKISESITETMALTEARDTLLPKLLSGEIDLQG